MSPSVQSDKIIVPSMKIANLFWTRLHQCRNLCVNKHTYQLNTPTKIVMNERTNIRHHANSRYLAYLPEPHLLGAWDSVVDDRNRSPLRAAEGRLWYSTHPDENQRTLRGSSLLETNGTAGQNLRRVLAPGSTPVRQLKMTIVRYSLFRCTSCTVIYEWRQPMCKTEHDMAR